MCVAHRASDAGFVAVDALVGLSILASTLAFATLAGVTAVKLSARATSLDHANAELLALIETTPAKIGEVSGNTRDYAWSVTVKAAALKSAPDLCRIDATLKPKDGHSSFWMATLRPCMAETGHG